MGNRQDLLAGAKRCLYEKGYARITSRDIASSAGVSLAAIVYHFRSKEALLTEAMLLAMGEWSNELQESLSAVDLARCSPLERFEIVWDRVIGSFAKYRQIWAASFDLFSQADQMPEVRAIFEESQERARFGLSQLLQNIDPAKDEHSARIVGSFYYALLSGVIAQLLVAPEKAPSARDLADALQIITRAAKTK
jgi:AcrR family transcriptional regulator